MDSFSKRLQHVARLKKIYQTDLRAGLEQSSATISRWWTGKITPGPKNMREIADFLGCDYHWLAKGEGSPPSAGLMVAESAAAYRHGSRPGPAAAGLVDVTYHEEGYGHAGDGIINHETAPTVMQFEREFLVGRFGISRFEHIHIINAVGDSMQDGIQPGDLLFVNPVDIDIVTGAIYALVIGDKTLVKRAEYNPVSGELTLISDNKKYKPLTVSGQDLDKVRVVGRVIGNLRKL